MATEILKKQTIVGTDAQYEANRNSYGEGTVFESTSLLGENDIDPTYTNKFVSKVTTKAIVYGTSASDGSPRTIPWNTAEVANTLVMRDSGGRAKIQTPLLADQIANKRYVDDGFIAKYINGGIVYANDTSGSQTGIEYSEGADKYTIAIRSENGCVRTADPEGQNDAVTKSYADNRFRYTHLIEVKFNPAPEPYVSYVLIGIITYVSESSTPLTSIDDLPLDVALPIHGKLNIDTFQDTYTATRKTRKNGTSYLNITYMYYSDSDGIGTGTQGDIVPTSFTDTVV